MCLHLASNAKFDPMVDMDNVEIEFNDYNEEEDNDSTKITPEKENI